VDMEVRAEENRVSLLLEVVAGSLDFAPCLVHDAPNLLALGRS